MLPKPKDRVANQTDRVGWTDLFHGFVSVEAWRPSLATHSPRSRPRNLWNIVNFNLALVA
jgi:hypothetical protein